MASPSGVEMVVEFINPLYCMAEFGNVSVGFWKTPFDRENLPDVKKFLRLNRGRYPGGVYHFTTMSAENINIRAMADDEMRNEVIALGRSAAGHIHRSALVIEGTGFAAATMRSVSVTVTNILRAVLPVRVMADQESAIKWILDERPNTTPQFRRDFAESARALRKRFDQLSVPQPLG